MRHLVLVLVLMISTFFGCTNFPATQNDPSAERGVRALEQQLEAYHRELTRLVGAGELDTEQAEKFYQIARVETIRRIARLNDRQRPTAMDASFPLRQSAVGDWVPARIGLQPALNVLGIAVWTAYLDLLCPT